jgi:GNAT superfamily N-acetyltransferase
MATDELPGPAETAVLDALHRGALRTRCSARAIPALRNQPGGEQLLHEILDRCEARGLVRSDRYRDRRQWTLTAAGRARLRTRRRFARALALVLTRTG